MRLLRLPSAIPAIKQQMTTSLLRPFKIQHKKCVVATLTCNNPLIDPCGFCISPPSLSSLLSARLSHIHPPHSVSLRAPVEIRSSLSEVLCHVAQGAWNSPRAVEQTQAQGLSIAAPQTNCLSNEPPSLSCPHTHTHAYAHTCVRCDIHALAHARTHTRAQRRFDSKSSDTLLEEKTHEWHFSVCRLVSSIVTSVCSAVTVRLPFCYY